tara:strand:- start:5869 stop:7110 length:1242 start_codon:yes stop_codon:yes gene_type:complete
MKNLKHILNILFILFFLSCDAFNEIASSVEEGETELDNSFYIEEAWSSMNLDEYVDAINFFEFLVTNISESYPEGEEFSTNDLQLLVQANHGLAWAKLLHSSTPLSSNKKDDRDEAYDLFFAAQDILDYHENLNFEGLDQIQCDIYAGKILYADYMVYYYQNLLSNGGDIQGDEQLQRDYFSQGEPGGEDYNGNGYIELGIESLILDMQENCSNYDFQNYEFDHNISLDINDLRLILAKDYMRRSDYLLAKDVVSSIMENSESTNILFKLNAQSEVLESTKVVGDFENKTIDAADVYDLELSEDGFYYVNISVNQSMPCNFSPNNSDNISSIRDELFECVNGYDYFNSNNNNTYKYRFIIGEYDADIISNQESNLPSSCSSNDSYRIIQIPYNSFGAINLDPVCFNSCSSNCN